jgi:hypothetical protein
MQLNVESRVAALLGLDTLHCAPRSEALAACARVTTAAPGMMRPSQLAGPHRIDKESRAWKTQSQEPKPLA